jgi:hypothetical protein
LNTRERLTAALEGNTPDITPLSIYSWMIDDRTRDDWRRLLDLGLGTSENCPTMNSIEHGVEHVHDERRDGSNVTTLHTLKTPVGSISELNVNGWRTEHCLKSPQDYKVMQWIVENAEVVPAYEEFDRCDAVAGSTGLPIVSCGRTPAMSINVDWAGTEQFCLDVAMEVPELFELYEARKKKFMEEIRLIAAGPGRFVKMWENLTIGMLGPGRYRDLLMNVYNEAVPILEASGKRAMVHYDGALGCIADQIAGAPFHMIESLTEPPEGDMTYDQCRAVWPDKVFWANINVDFYYRPEAELRAEVIAKRERAGKRALAFEISEDLPRNWKTSIPVVVNTLNELG